MGHQVRFYFAPDDEAMLLDLIDKQRYEFVCSGLSKEPKAELYGSFGDHATEGSDRKVLIGLRGEIGLLRYGNVYDKGYLADTTVSPVIELIRSGLIPARNILVWGRIWYQHKYWDKDATGRSVIVAKNPELLRLYNRLASWIRRHGERLPNGNYLAPGAKKLVEQGVSLV